MGVSYGYVAGDESNIKENETAGQECMMSKGE